MGLLSLLSLLHSIMIKGSMTCSFPFLDAIVVEGDLLSVVLLVLRTLWCIAAVLRRRVAHKHIHRPMSLLVLRYRFWLCDFNLLFSHICQKLLDDPVAIVLLSAHWLLSTWHSLSFDARRKTLSGPWKVAPLVRFPALCFRVS